MTDMIKKALISLAIIAILVPTAAWLAKPKERVEYEDGKVVVEWFNYVTPELLKLFEDELIPAFEKQHPKIKIHLISTLGDTGFEAKLLTLIAGDIAPDVIRVTQLNFPYFATKDMLLDVNPLIKNDPEFDIHDYFERITDGMRYQGKLLGLPSDFSTIVLFYNKRLFDEYGVPYPDETWDYKKFLWAARKLTRDTDGDGVTDQFGFANAPRYNRWPGWVWVFGGDLFTPDVKRCTMDDPKSIEGFKFYVDLSTKYKVSPTTAESAGRDYEELFLAERIAMIADSRYIYKRFADGVSFPWDIAPMPKGECRATTYIWGGYSILKSSKHPKEAWEFLKFLSDREGALLNTKAGNALPAHKQVAVSEVMHRSGVSPPHDRIFLDAIAYARQAPFPPQYAEYWQAVGGLEDAWLGTIPVEEVCMRFTKQVNEAISGEVW